MAEPFEIAGHVVKPGQRVRIELPVVKLYTDTSISIPVEIIRARKSGPVFFVSAAIHGDELNGIEVVRRLIQSKSLKLSKGTLILVPMVNVYGVLNQSRYLPDRRDLNRSFPGSEKGSLAGQIADTLLSEIISQCHYGVDLHTGAIHRSNLPQIRANLKDEETKLLAESFGVPVLLNANLRDGSLRQASVEHGVKILLYEAGQALRFDEFSIKVGVRGVLNCLTQLGMIKKRRQSKTPKRFIANHSTWIRANASGIVSDLKKLGDSVEKNESLAKIGNPFGDVIDTVKATRAGIIIGKQNIPLVQQGDAMYHIAYFSEEDDDIVDQIEQLQENLGVEGDMDTEWN